MKNLVVYVLAAGFGLLTGVIAVVAWGRLLAGHGSLLEVVFYTCLTLLVVFAFVYDARKALRRRRAAPRSDRATVSTGR
jgi:uncharacterized membrane protein YdjX (TVP38/TMEM64 family)